MVNHQVILNLYKDKTVIVTGHTGFKGSWLIQILHLAGAKIIGIALSPVHKNDLYNEIGADQWMMHDFIQDIRDVSALQIIFTKYKPDFVFHLAAQALVLQSYAEPRYTFDVNLMGTINVLEALRQAQNPCVSVLITTDKVYHNEEKVYAYHEDDKLGGYDPYSASKATCEIAISSYIDSFFNPKQYEKHQQKICSARAGNVIGGGDLSDNRIIPDLYKMVTEKGTLHIRRPESVRPWQHVIEPVWAYLYLAYVMYHGAPDMIRKLNIGPDQSDVLHVSELIEIFLENIKHSGELIFDKDEPEHHEAGLLMLDIALAQKLIGWSPILNSRQAIKWTAEWYFSSLPAPVKCQEQITKYLQLWDLRNQHEL